METQNKELKSIWGRWWEPLRKYFYPLWLVYELSYRFYEYALTTYQYIEEISNQILAILSGAVMFATCTAFLTVPAGLVLYNFFKIGNLTGASFEERIKKCF